MINDKEMKSHLNRAQCILKKLLNPSLNNPKELESMFDLKCAFLIGCGFTITELIKKINLKNTEDEEELEQFFECFEDMVNHIVEASNFAFKYKEE